MYNDWFADQVFTQLQNGKGPTDVKISSKSSHLKPIHAKWIVHWYNHVIKEKEMIVRGSCFFAFKFNPNRHCKFLDAF